MSAAAATATKNPIDLFVQGARQGWSIVTGNMLPNIIMAFVIIRILQLTKLLDLIGAVASPVMALWGLPGAALVVLCAALLSRGGSVGVAAGLVGSGQLSGADISVLAPAMMLMGALVQQTGRCLGSSDCNRRYWGWHILICIINAMLGMWMMRLFMLFI